MASIFDLIVRLSGNGQSLRDDIDKDKAVIQSLMDEIHNKDMTIEANTADAEAKLDHMKQTLREVQDTHATINLDDQKAQDEVDKLKLKLDDLVYRALKINVDDLDAEAKLKDLQARIDKLRLDYARVPISIEDGSAKEKIDAIKMDLATLHDKTVVVDVKERGGAGGAAGAGLLGLLGLIPAASPLAAAGVGGGMGLASSLLSGLVGTLGLGAVATTDLKPVFSGVSGYNQDMQAASTATTATQRNQDLAKAAAAWRTMSAAQQQAATSLVSFENFWKSFSASFNRPVFGMFTNGLKMLQSLATDLRPSIAGAASAFTQLLADADKALNAPFWKRFFTWLGGSAKQSILDWGHAFGNTFKGLAALLQDFSPITNMVMKGLDGVTSRFAQWAIQLKNTQGFKQFLDYVRREGPVVWKLISTLAKVIEQLLVAMAPTGALILDMATSIIKLISDLLKINPLVGQFAVAIGEGILVLRVLKPLIATLGGPWQIVIAAIVAGAILVITHWKQIVAFARQMWTDISKYFKSLDTDVTKIWTSLWSGMKNILNKSALGPFVKAYGTAIAGEFKVFVDLLTGQWSKAWQQMKKSLSSIWNEIKNTEFGRMLSDAEQWGAHLVQSIARGIENAISSVISAARNVVNSVEHIFGGGTSVPSNSSVGNMVQGSSGGSASPQSITVTHQGSVQVAGLTPAAVQQVNQKLYGHYTRMAR